MTLKAASLQPDVSKLFQKTSVIALMQPSKRNKTEQLCTTQLSTTSYHFQGLTLHLEPFTPGLWQYILVLTCLYVPICTLPMYVPVRTFRNFRMTVHTSTYWYRQITKSMYEYVQVRTLLCLSLYMAVHGSTW